MGFRFLRKGYEALVAKIEELGGVAPDLPPPVRRVGRMRSMRHGRLASCSGRPMRMRLRTSGWRASRENDVSGQRRRPPTKTTAR